MMPDPVSARLYRVVLNKPYSRIRTNKASIHHAIGLALSLTKLKGLDEGGIC